MSGAAGADTIRLLLAVGWLAHLAGWLAAMAAAGGRAAAGHEWIRELALRAGMATLLVASLLVPPGRWWILPAGLGNPLLVMFLLAQATAIVARIQLGHRWGIGVEPRAGGTQPRTSGLYRHLGHPIYVCCCVALLLQTLLVQNAPSVVLLAGAAVVTTVKARRESAAWKRAVSETP